MHFTNYGRNTSTIPRTSHSCDHPAPHFPSSKPAGKCKINNIRYMTCYVRAHKIEYGGHITSVYTVTCIFLSLSLSHYLMLINMKYCFNQSPFVSLIDDYQLSLHVHTCISLNYPPSLSSTDLLAFISIDLRKYLHMAWEYCSAVLYIWFRRMFIYTCTSEQFSTHGNDFLLILMCYTGFSP